MNMDFETIRQRYSNEGVPGELIAQLHDANARFHDARCGLEEAMLDSSYDHQSRIHEREDEVRRAEHALEQISDKIHDVLQQPP